MHVLQDPAGVPYNGVVDTCRRLLVESRSENSSTYLKSWGSLRVFFRGVEPRVMWIGIGGFVFFGAYEQAATLLSAVI
jgi:solute carrier family 25 S-adenosylmethionine transporter 26